MTRKTEYRELAYNPEVENNYSAESRERHKALMAKLAETIARIRPESNFSIEEGQGGLYEIKPGGKK